MKPIHIQMPMYSVHIHAHYIYRNIYGTQLRLWLQKALLTSDAEDSSLDEWYIINTLFKMYIVQKISTRGRINTLFELHIV